jgi:hypothetical protein
MAAAAARRRLGFNNNGLAPAAAPAALTPPPLRRTLTSSMPSGFDAAFTKVKELMADSRANEKFYFFPPRQPPRLNRKRVIGMGAHEL